MLRLAKYRSGQRESNPHEKLGKLPGYHYIMPAQTSDKGRAPLRSRRALRLNDFPSAWSPRKLTRDICISVPNPGERPHRGIDILR